jgi:hypothetical protein
MVHGCWADFRTGAACQRQHWTSHKRQCRALAEAELISSFGQYTIDGMKRILYHPEPSELPLFPKLSAITWTTRPQHCELHIQGLIGRAILLDKGHPLTGDTKAKLIQLLKRAVTELPWPELPGGTIEMIETYFGALTCLDKFGEPEAAVEISSRHVEDVEKKVVTSDHLGMYQVFRLDWLLSAAYTNRDDEAKRGAYVAEAKGLMERVRRSLRGSRSQDWVARVSGSTEIAGNRVMNLTPLLCADAGEIRVDFGSWDWPAALPRDDRHVSRALQGRTSQPAARVLQQSCQLDDGPAQAG